jgi:two-component system response regulator (stage 0 sporulation protein F)
MATKILIVEDDADFAVSLDLALDLIGFTSVIAGSAEEALEIMSLESGDIKMGFFDIKLPQEDGISCYEKIRSLNPDFTGVVMTGFRDQEILDRARAAGAVDILLKPFKMAYFMDLVKTYSTPTTQ